VAGALLEGGNPVWVDPTLVLGLWAAFGHAVGYTIYPLVITAVGDARGGHGQLGAAYLGALAGLAIQGGAAALGAHLIRSSEEALGAVVCAVGGVAGLIAPVLAYGLSDDGSTSADVTPTVSFDSHGGVVGVTGRF
jgi:hypothetical protein